MVDFLLILALGGWVWRATRDDFSRGLPLVLGLMVFLPGTLRFELPGVWPELTAHRVLLLVLGCRWSQQGRGDSLVRPTIALGWIFALMLASRMISVALSVSLAPSIKDLLSFAMETVFFFYLCLAGLRTLGQLNAATHAVGLALTAVAGIALIERYADVSLPVVLLPHFKHCHNGIQSTYPHRILLGYGMAMGLPVVLYLLSRARTWRSRLAWLASLLAIVVACFLSDSRGGWLGMATAGALSLVFGSASVRRTCVFLGVLTALTLALRPGIRETIQSRIHDTYAGDSYKGTSYRYRWRLWDVAFSEIGRSPERLLFGYGGLSTESMDLSRYFREQEGGMTTKTGFTSWDNHYASDLVEFGAFGLGVEVVGFLALGVQLWFAWRRTDGTRRALLGIALVAGAVFLFARTNVYIFGEQPRFLFWALIAFGVAASRQPVTAPAPLVYSPGLRPASLAP